MFLTESAKERIVKAIKDAELNTSGEVKVHIEETCPTDDPTERAKQVFQYLRLESTAQRNGVLFYLAYGNHKFAIWGDEGIDKVVPINFWEGIRDSMRQYFLQEDFAGGLQMGIREAGNQLKKFFPYHQDDVNEISDDVSTEPIP